MRKMFCLSVAIVSLVACGGYSSSAPTTSGNTPAPTGGVSVTNSGFSPVSMTVTMGTTVRWFWNSCTGDPYLGTEVCTPHSVTFDDGSASSPPPSQDRGTFSRTFSVAGTYRYHCNEHPAETGVVTVTTQ